MDGKVDRAGRLSPPFLKTGIVERTPSPTLIDVHSGGGPKKNEGKKVPILGDMLFRFYRICPRYLRKLVVRTLMRLEGGGLYSVTVRRILYTYHDIEVGMYTGLLAAIRGGLPPGTKIGRYTSINASVKMFGASHPTNTRSSHALFYNPKFGYAKHDLLNRTRPTIGNDVFIGHNTIITNRVASIGDGAYIGAGSVVTKDVPPYALVGGNPARIIRYRFSMETIRGLLQERWWEASIDELMLDLRRFQVPLEDDEVNH